MEISPLLVVGIVLLVAILGLSLWQRSQQVDRTAGRQTSNGAPGAASRGHDTADATEPESQFVFSRDDLLGVIEYDEGVWTADDEQPFAGTTVIVEVHGDRSGLTEAQREILTLALKYPRDLDGRAREVIQRELDRQGITEGTMEAYELTVRTGDDGRDVGFLWYDVEEADREMGVSSIDGWKTLQLERPG